jgi:hypothetical protein
MNPLHTGGIERTGASPLQVDVSEITSVVVPVAEVAVYRSRLLPWEQEASLSSPRDLPDFAIGPVSRFLGPLLTAASPVWSTHAMTRLRSLQKRLIAQSLALPEDDRLDCLEAVSMIEQAVVLRLRLEQMAMMDEQAATPAATAMPAATPARGAP